MGRIHQRDTSVQKHVEKDEEFSKFRLVFLFIVFAILTSNHNNLASRTWQLRADLMKTYSPDRWITRTYIQPIYLEWPSFCILVVVMNL